MSFLSLLFCSISIFAISFYSTKAVSLKEQAQTTISPRVQIKIFPSHSSFYTSCHFISLCIALFCLQLFSFFSFNFFASFVFTVAQTRTGIAGRKYSSHLTPYYPILSHLALSHLILSHLISLNFITFIYVDVPASYLSSIASCTVLYCTPLHCTVM